MTEKCVIRHLCQLIVFSLFLTQVHLNVKGATDTCVQSLTFNCISSFCMYDIEMRH